MNGGASHSLAAAQADIDGGKMDGFLQAADTLSGRGCGATNPPTKACLTSGVPDVMGYHDAREIPELLDVRGRLHAK